jgi:hypothetical protein
MKGRGPWGAAPQGMESAAGPRRVLYFDRFTNSMSAASQNTFSSLIQLP